MWGRSLCDYFYSGRVLAFGLLYTKVYNRGTKCRAPKLILHPVPQDQSQPQEPTAAAQGDNSTAPQGHAARGALRPGPASHQQLGPNTGQGTGPQLSKQPPTHHKGRGWGKSHTPTTPRQQQPPKIAQAREMQAREAGPKHYQGPTPPQSPAARPGCQAGPAGEKNQAAMCVSQGGSPPKPPPPIAGAQVGQENQGAPPPERPKRTPRPGPPSQPRPVLTLSPAGPARRPRQAGTLSAVQTALCRHSQPPRASLRRSRCAPGSGGCSPDKTGGFISPPSRA
ncbi:hypothetical protein NDU88_004293 [Pleurodeles waltl]|uniref:Uncharacterized protein n=1 Tax=Pleurodeles waltl TaxID=8319 RepID=A0AAV7WVG4_PLEWA|nr:hypothetical protein NDU88_004293 [Pleurodeles waltl]